MLLGTRHGENLLPLFLNAVWCEFNVQKRCQTTNPAEQNCLFSEELAELSEQHLSAEAPQHHSPAQPGRGGRTCPELAGQPGLQHTREHRWVHTVRVSFRNLTTNPYFSLSPCLKSASICTMLRCLASPTWFIKAQVYLRLFSRIPFHSVTSLWPSPLFFLYFDSCGNSFQKVRKI